MKYHLGTHFAVGLLLFVATPGIVQTGATTDRPATFAPFEQWKNAILSGDAAGLRALYSTNPPAKVRANKVEVDANADVSFWLALKARSMKVETVRLIGRGDLESVIFNTDVIAGGRNGQTVVVADDQVWQKQGDQWRLRSVARTDAPRLKQPSDMKKDIYPASADAHADLKAAEMKAAKERKRLLLVFGANWCYDCHVLDLAFQRADLASVLASSYEVVHVDLGPDEQKNSDLVKQFEVPLNKGIPALAVAESDGKLVISQKNGEFENARGLAPDALLEFLNRWKPRAQ
jgi:thioredoxin family protein